MIFSRLFIFLTLLFGHASCYSDDWELTCLTEEFLLENIYETFQNISMVCLNNNITDYEKCQRIAEFTFDPEVYYEFSNDLHLVWELGFPYVYYCELIGANVENFYETIDMELFITELIQEFNLTDLLLMNETDIEEISMELEYYLEKFMANWPNASKQVFMNIDFDADYELFCKESSLNKDCRTLFQNMVDYNLLENMLGSTN